jgi:hypothetical protein
MEKNNQKSFPRKTFLTVNKYQEKIVMMALAPTAVLFTTLLALLIFGNPAIMERFFHIPIDELMILISKISFAIVWVLFLVTIIFVALVFKVSHNLLGAFGRIIRELDDVIEGRSKKEIYARPGEELSGDILKRVNVLIKAYVEKRP